MNLSILRGNLTRDPELRSTTGGTMVCRFSIAVNDGTQERPHSSYFDCVAWAEQAEDIARKFTKGMQVEIVGRARQERWKDQAGKSQSKVSFQVDHYKTLVRAKRQAESGGHVASTLAEEMGATPVDNPMGDDDIPF